MKTHTERCLKIMTLRNKMLVSYSNNVFDSFCLGNIRDSCHQYECEDVYELVELEVWLSVMGIRNLIDRKTTEYFFKLGQHV